MGFTRIEDVDLNNVGVIGLPDRPGLSTAAMQNKLEETSRSVVIPKHNGLIDELEDVTAAENIGITPPTGRTGTKIKAVIDELSSAVDGTVKDTFKNIESGGTTYTASGEDTFKINAGSNVTITPLVGDKGISISATGGGQSTGDMLMSDYDSSGDIKSASSTGNGIKDYVTSAISGKADSSSLASVATSGSYNDLSNTPNLATVATSGSYNDLSNRPNLASVATSGSYSDLSNTPNIPSVSDQYNSTSSNAMSGKAVAQAIATKSNVSVTQVVSSGTKIATISVDGVGTDIYESGGSAAIAYDKAKVGSTTLQATAGNTTLELKAGSNVTLTPNASDNSVTIAASGGGQSTGDMLMSDYDPNATVKNTTGGITAYVSSAISGKADSSSLSTVATSGAYSDLSGTPTLATVATSGSYADLSNKPNIPAAQVNSDWDATTGVAKILNKPTIPTVVNTYSSSGTDAISGTGVNAALQTLDVTTSGAGASKTLTALSQTDGKISATFGNISITKSQVSDFPSLATVATSGSYNDLTNQPTIPDELSDLTGDVSISSPSQNQILQYNGSKWGNASLPVSIAGNGTASSSAVHSQQLTINSSATDIDGTKYMEIASTSSTTYTFTNAAITSTSAIDVYTDTWGDNPSSVTASSGSCTVTFSVAQTRTVRIYIK